MSARFPGHAIINLGDAMVKLTRGLLLSNIHRVTSAPGARAEYSLFSLAYLARPADATLMKGLEGSSVIPKLAEGEVEEGLTQKEWTNRRIEAMKVKNYKIDMWQQTRGTEQQAMKHGKPIKTERAS